MKVKASQMPSQSILSTSQEGYDYIDSFQAKLKDVNNSFRPEDAGKAFFTAAPKWIEKLLILRNRIVSVFGLKAPEDTNRQEVLDSFKCEKGEKLGLFKVLEKTNEEVVFGEEDKHLNFKVSIYLDDTSWTNENPVKSLTITTVVKFNNIFGKIYFVPVRPFHKIIVPTMLKGIVRELEKKNQGL